MAKLGYALTLAGLKKATSIYNSTDGVGNSIYITGDGYLVTKTDEFKLLLNWDSISNNSLIIKNNSGTFTSTDVPTTDGQVLKWDATNNKFIWKSDLDTRYTLTINGTPSTYTLNTENSLGTIYAPTSSGTGIPSLSETTWSWNTIVDTIGDSSTGIPTVSALKNYVGTATAGLTAAMHYIGSVSKNPTETAPTEAETPTGGFENGDVVTFGKKEFVYSSSGWRELGDEGSYALKTISISAGTGLTGGGNLESDRTLSLATITKTNTTPDGGSLSYGGTLNVVTGVTYDDYGRVTGVATTKYTLPSTDEIDYSSSLFWATNNSTKATANVNTATSDPYLLLIQNNALKTAVKFAGSTYLGVSANGDTITFTNNGIKTLSYTDNGNSSSSYKYTIGTLTINGTDTTIYGKDTNTWRPVYAWQTSQLGSTGDTLDKLIEYGGTGVAGLAFSPTFGYSEQTVDNIKYAEIDLVWAEIDNDGKVTYAI